MQIFSINLSTSSNKLASCRRPLYFNLVLGFFVILGIFSWNVRAYGQIDQSNNSSPIEVVRTIAEKAIKETRFEFRYTMPAKYKETEIVDFSNNFGKNAPGVAYAASSIISGDTQEVTFEISHNDHVKIWINGEVAYDQAADGTVEVVYNEKTYTLKNKFNSRLQKGTNEIFIQAETKGKGDWVFYLQSAGMKEPSASAKNIYFSLEKLAPDIKGSNWLILGRFPAIVQEIETQFKPGEFYKSADEILTWTVPKMEIFADVINNGEFYNWNYHVGGFMWAMQALSDETKQLKYARFSRQWMNFMIDNRPLIEHQVKKLHGVKSAFNTMIDRPMLDYTTAPALPFISRLVREGKFDEREEYTSFVSPIIAYAKKGQVRLQDGTFARKEPVELSVWVDDMFMGIPFLLFSAELSSDKSERERLYNDAASQVISFNKHLFDTGINLYRHTYSSTRPENRYPHWSRANGWGLWAAAEVLLRLPKHHPLYQKIMLIYRSHIDALVKLQNPETGFWRNVLDKTESKDETSGTAIFTMALARGVNNKWLKGAKYKTSAMKGWKALQTAIEKDGTVHGTVVGTNVSMDLKFYYNRPVMDNDTHGLFPLIFAGIEMERMLKK
ncbi:glycoside hydrolase family 88/105 protein [Chitinophaga barathri]|uniref:Glycoside hydrolase family 88 protein n=1 Tax=Chitinophaga barathri TaxID=1647451 RepID=A0A3N4MLQ7_9BACT|nr:glycoside hydrolase family 88 protein [Chitinophaga barathri]RPD42996.1 hypothetical protein EG028_01520 [Chitinophaga barathri]